MEEVAGLKSPLPSYFKNEQSRPNRYQVIQLDRNLKSHQYQ